MNRRLFRISLAAFLTAVLHTPGLAGGEASAAVDQTKPLEVVQAAIEAMGGERYLDVETMATSGRYFGFRKGRKSFTRFEDFTVYKPPVKSHFALGKGKRKTIWVYNMELGKGWKQEGPFDVAELGPDDIKDFKRRVKQDMDYLFRHRLDEEGLRMFYYGPDEIAGSGMLEAVEFIDTSNDSIVIFFNRDTHLPAKTETHFVGQLGIRHKQEYEFDNWHDINGVLVPHNYYGYVDGEKSEERFLESALVNPPLPPELFLEPVVKERKSKKKKKN